MALLVFMGISSCALRVGSVLRSASCPRAVAIGQRGHSIMLAGTAAKESRAAKRVAKSSITTEALEPAADTPPAGGALARGGHPPYLFVVESPSKAKTLGQYLGDDYKVIATKGHVRVLRPKRGSVAPDDDFAMTFEVPLKQREHLAHIVEQARHARTVYLAMDPDREGEAIAWHLLHELRKSGIPLAASASAALTAANVVREPVDEEDAAASKPARSRKRSAAAAAASAAADGADAVNVWRVSFNSVSREAVLAALANPRAIDLDLVAAQQARQALDYLVGFTLSPVLWKRMPAARSAGRVQSVALRLLTERETARDMHVCVRYWDVLATLGVSAGAQLAAAGSGETGTPPSSFSARVGTVNGRSIGKLSLRAEADALALKQAAEAARWSVSSVRSGRVSKAPRPPYNTASLQQDASVRLRLPVTRAMQVAQQLYEGVKLEGEQEELVGLITYMRTDAVNISDAAVADVREAIVREFGEDALPPAGPRVHRSTSRNAQEAHEAIRPVDMARVPWQPQLERSLTAEQLALYSLVWRRTAASQMADAVFDSTSVVLLGELGASEGAGQAGQAALPDSAGALPPKAKRGRKPTAAAAAADGALEGEDAGGPHAEAAMSESETPEVLDLGSIGAISTVGARARGRVLVSPGFRLAFTKRVSATAAAALSAAAAEAAAEAEAEGGGAGDGAGQDEVDAPSAAGSEGEGGDDTDGSSSVLLPPLSSGDGLWLLEAGSKEHATKPSARFSEASLIKRLDELGIGRPSTYAPTMQVLRNRGYAVVDASRLVPTLTGRFAAAFLTEHFERYVQFDFTAAAEEQLDFISAGKVSRPAVLGSFWGPLATLAEEVALKSPQDAWRALDSKLGYLAFLPDAIAAMGGGEPSERAGLPPLSGHEQAAAGNASASSALAKAGLLLPSRACPDCGSGVLTIKHSRFGPFVGCSAHPQCTHSESMPQLPALSQLDEGDEGSRTDLPRSLGLDHSGREVSVRLGPFSFYVQREAQQPQSAAEDGPMAQSLELSKLSVGLLRTHLLELGLQLPKLRRKAELASALREAKGLPAVPDLPDAQLELGLERRGLPRALSAFNVTLDEALRLFELPRALGEHPALGGAMTARLGPKAGYIEHDSYRYWLEEPALAFGITGESAAQLISAVQDGPKSPGGKLRGATRINPRRGGAIGASAPARTAAPRLRKKATAVAAADTDPEIVFAD